MTKFTRKMHTGEAGNPGQFGSRTRNTDTITLEDQAHGQARHAAGVTMTVSGTVAGAVGIGLMAVPASGMLPLTVVFGSVAVIGVGSALRNSADRLRAAGARAKKFTESRRSDLPGVQESVVAAPERRFYPEAVHWPNLAESRASLALAR